ncbi:MAG: rhomboid family intramembrane serine protease [Proteobacteria bacterium]|nr:rhomboid family intramembrane serine protease [Pseudomonadota bacterium]
MQEQNRMKDDGPVLPPVVQPVGLNYWLGTVSGRLMLINTVVFLIMCWKSNSIFLPTREVLLEFGAKDSVGLVRGEVWRFLTPVFVHIGVIHFFFNSMGLYYIGYQLERILGRRWFVAVYLGAGIFGNIASAVSTVAMSAGASGALFGLLGSGYVLERVVGQRMEQVTGRRPRRRIYGGMVVINIIFGLMIPGIDNAAHMGGLAAGMVLTWSMLHLRPNRLTRRNKPAAYAAVAALVAAAVAGVGVSTNSNLLVARFEKFAESASSATEGIYYLEQALRILPGDQHLIAEKVKLILMSADPHDAISDIRHLSENPSGIEELRRLQQDFQRDGLTRQSKFLDFFLSDGAGPEPI